MLRKMLALVVIFSVVIGSNASIGPYLKPCRSGDIPCAAAANMRLAIPCFADGIPELGIRGLEPMSFNNITSDQGFFKLQFPELRIYGTKQCKVADMSTDLLQSTTSVTLDCPLETIGKYIASARSYFFNIKNEGNVLLQSDSIRTTVTSKFETIYGPDGKQYMNLIDYEYFYEPTEKFYIELGNLFKGEVERGQYFTNFMPNGFIVSLGRIAEPLVTPIVQEFFNVLKATLLRYPIN